MAYLTDKEKRLLFSALTREKKVCVEVDKECCRETYEDTLESVVKNLEKKFYYDRFEKEIRANAIDEFVEKFIYKAVCEGCSGCCNCYEEGKQSECEDWKTYMEIAEQLKEGAK